MHLEKTYLDHTITPAKPVSDAAKDKQDNDQAMGGVDRQLFRRNQGHNLTVNLFE